MYCSLGVFLGGSGQGVVAKGASLPRVGQSGFFF